MVARSPGHLLGRKLHSFTYQGHDAPGVLGSRIRGQDLSPPSVMPPSTCIPLATTKDIRSYFRSYFRLYFRG